MIPVSLLLIAGAITLLVLGLWQSSSALLGASIAASLLAAVLLVLGARRSSAVAGATRPDTGSRPRTPPVHDGSGSERATGARTRGDSRGDRAATHAHIPTQPAPPHEPSRHEPSRHEPSRHEPALLERAQPEPASVEAGHPDADGYLDEPDDADLDPPDEPAPQQVSAADAARVGRMLTEVLVVDGRPRYHLPGCVHLLGRDSEPLPVGEAVELGFTPCSLCEPDSALLADARRV